MKYSALLNSLKSSIKNIKPFNLKKVFVNSKSGNQETKNVLDYLSYIPSNVEMNKYLTNFSQNNPNIIETPIIKNRLFKETGLGFGKNNPIALSTNSKNAYRVVGNDAIDDLLNVGIVRPKPGRKVKGGHVNEVHWAQGEPEKLFYYDKRPVLVIDADQISKFAETPISISQLKHLYTFDSASNKYIDFLPNLKIV